MTAIHRSIVTLVSMLLLGASPTLACDRCGKACCSKKVVHVYCCCEKKCGHGCCGRDRDRDDSWRDRGGDELVATVRTLPIVQAAPMIYAQPMAYPMPMMSPMGYNQRGYDSRQRSDEVRDCCEKLDKKVDQIAEQLNQVAELAKENRKAIGGLIALAEKAKLGQELDQ
ncbi:MAG: hypothetical protein AAF266_04675 [Planctomycetota bacterium]